MALDSFFHNTEPSAIPSPEGDQFTIYRNKNIARVPAALGAKYLAKFSDGFEEEISPPSSGIGSQTILFSAAGITDLFSAFTIGDGTPASLMGAPINGVTSYYTRLSKGGVLKNLRGFIQMSNAVDGGTYDFNIYTAPNTGDNPLGDSPSPFFTNSGIAFTINTASGEFFFANSDLQNQKVVNAGDYIALVINVGTTTFGSQVSIGASITLE